jgi:coenzyme PQQ precursor peptide PqqA
MAARLACQARLAELLIGTHAPFDRRGLRSGAKGPAQLPVRSRYLDLPRHREFNGTERTSTAISSGTHASAPRFQEETTMKWTAPRIVEIAVGLEINAYACAELN